MKKLTAGIFTVLMGLVTVNAADAAVASKGYVDTKVGTATSAVNTLEQTVTANKNAAETAIAKAEKAGTDAAAALESYKTTNDGRVLAVEGEVDDLQTTVSGHTASIEAINTELDTMATSEAVLGLTTRVGTAEGEIDGLQAADTALQGKIDAINHETTGVLASAKAYADAEDDKIEEKIGTIATGSTVSSLIEANAGAIADVEELVGDTAVATQISNAIVTARSEYTTNELAGALANYTKTEKFKALAFKDTVDTEDIVDGAVTSGKLADGAVTDAKITAVSSAKVTGLADSLAEKMDITSKTTEEGIYVLTANVSTDGVADYAWEKIER